MVAHVVAAYRLQQGVGTDDIGLHERPRFGEGIVVMRFGGEVDHGVDTADELVDQIQIGDVTVHEVDAVGHRLERRPISGVGQSVKDGYGGVGTTCHRLLDEIRTDEPGPAGYEQSHPMTLRRPLVTACRSLEKGQRGPLPPDPGGRIHLRGQIFNL